MSKGWTNTIIGVAEMAAGLFLVSPADEAIVAGGTAGVGLAAAPLQLIGTAALGAFMFYDGIKRL